MYVGLYYPGTSFFNMPFAPRLDVVEHLFQAHRVKHLCGVVVPHFILFFSHCTRPGILRFYTDDAPGLRIGPTVVLVFSLVFIGCVVLLHIWGKFKG